MSAKITRDTLEGFLHCKYKARLKLVGEQGSRCDYECLIEESRQRLRRQATEMILARHGEGDVATGVPLTEAELRLGQPFLLDFTAVWCGPCKRLAPIVEEIAQESEGKLRVGKLDIDDNQDTASRFGVMSVPTLMLFKNGEVLDQHVGLASKADLTSWITKATAK